MPAAKMGPVFEPWRTKIVEVPGEPLKTRLPHVFEDCGGFAMTTPRGKVSLKDRL